MRRRGRSSPRTSTDLLRVDPIELEIGYGLISLADAEQRRQPAQPGHADPPPDRAPTWASSCRPSASATTCSSGRTPTSCKLRGVEVARGEVPANRLLAMNPGTADGRRLDGHAGDRAGLRAAGASGSRPRPARARRAARLHRRRPVLGHHHPPVRDHSRSTRRRSSAARTSRRCSTASRPSTRRWSTSWCPTCSASARSRRCSSTCCASASRSATWSRSSRRWPTPRARRATPTC